MKRALVFDEDKNVLYSLTFALTNIGWEVITSTDCNTIIEQVHQSNPTVILITNNLSYQRGTISCQILKKHPALKHIPVVFYGESVVVSNLANFHIAMPFEIKNLENTMSEAYGLSNSNNLSEDQMVS